MRLQRIVVGPRALAVDRDIVWVDIVRIVRPIVRHPRVVVLEPSAGSCQLRRKVGGGENRHLKDSRQHAAQDRACSVYSHGRVSPISRFAVNRGPGPISRFQAPFPDSTGGIGNWDSLSPPN